MSFNTEINKPYIKPIILFEMDIGFQCGYWYPYQNAYTYYNQLDGDYSDIDDSGENFFSAGTETFPNITKIGSVIAGDNRLLEVFSPMECHQVEGSFFGMVLTEKFIYIYRHIYRLNCLK